MSPQRRERWWLGAFGLFLGLLAIWVLAVWWLAPAGAGPLGLGFSLRSRLRADYGPDPAARQMAVLHISIVEELMRDLGMSEEEAEAHAAEMLAAMREPVPTATARDFRGGSPLTATPSPTPVPTDTPEPTATPVPTRTRRPTATALPTNTPKPGPGPTDSAAPQICCAVWEPEPGPLETCTIELLDMEVYDPAPSSGISLSQSYLKYQDPDSGELITFPLELVSGGFEGAAWRGRFRGTIVLEDIEVSTALVGGARYASLLPASTLHSASPATILVWARIADKAGHTVYDGAHEYQLMVDCDGDDDD